MRPNNMSKEKTLKIGIIGSGFTGVSCFVNIIDAFLSKDILNKIEITLFDKGSVNGRGLAYSTRCAAHLLNTPSGTVGILCNKKDHFKQWLLSKLQEGILNYPDIDLQHPPREIYGQYIEEMFDLYLQKAVLMGINVNKKNEEVTEIGSADLGYTISTAQSNNLHFDYIILAIGGFDSEKPALLRHLNDFIISPYDEDFNNKIDKGDDVLIIGTRLSCVDAILALEENGHKGKVMCVSESGLLPRVIGEYNAKERLFITDEFIENSETISLPDVFNAIGNEYFLQEGVSPNFKDLFKTSFSPQKTLRYEIVKTKKKRFWQDSLYNTNHVLNKVWHKLDIKSKNKIIQKYLKFFLIYRAAMPRRSACKLLKLFEEGRLSLHKKPVSISFHEGLFEISLSNRSTLKAKHIIDATGLSYRICSSNSDLAKNITNSELFSLNQWGGISVSTETYQSVNKEGGFSNGLFVVGGAVFGTDLVTNLIEYIVECTSKVAQTIAENIKEQAL
jgi:uncharacterized NAD(P)/FAD-binding protein YdhS